MLIQRYSHRIHGQLIMNDGLLDGESDCLNVMVPDVIGTVSPIPALSPSSPSCQILTVEDSPALSD